MIYSISDIHAHYRELYRRIDQLGNLEPFISGDNQLILLGDYLDRGPNSKKVLELIFSLQQLIGSENIIVLKGNHESWFLQFLDGESNEWLPEDTNLLTSRTFLDSEQMAKIQEMASNGRLNAIYDFIRESIKSNDPELIAWLRKLPNYWESPETGTIFTHAGIDEESGELWKSTTPDDMFTGKYPLTTGKFYKDIVSGHVAASSIAENQNFKGIYYDGESHYFIDGAVEHTGNLLVLAYDEKNRNYYELEEETTEDKHLNYTRETRLQIRGNLKALN